MLPVSIFVENRMRKLYQIHLNHLKKITQNKMHSTFSRQFFIWVHKHRLDFAVDMKEERERDREKKKQEKKIH